MPEMSASDDVLP